MFQMTKIKIKKILGICPEQRITQDNELGFGEKQLEFREFRPGQRGETVISNQQVARSFPTSCLPEGCSIMPNF